MQKLRALYHFAACAGKWSAVFAASHLTIRHLGLPDTRTIPLALAAGSAVIIGKQIYKTGKNQPGHYPTNHPPSRKTTARTALPRHPFLLLLNPPDSAPPPSLTRDPTWFAAPNETTADYAAEASGADDRWRHFLEQLSGGRSADFFFGTAIILDTSRLLHSTPATLLRDAAGIRERLLDLHRAAGKNPPVYLVVDNLDILYGLRSLILATPARRLAQPLGAISDPNLENRPIAIVKAAHAEALVDLLDNATSTPSLDPAAVAASLQAPDEFKRLEVPLTRFAEVLFDHSTLSESLRLEYRYLGNDDTEPRDEIPPAPRLGGLFFTASCPGAVTLPPLLGELAGFLEAPEPQPDSTSWFARDLFAHTLPADAARKKGKITATRARTKFPAAVGWLTAACLVLSGLLTWSFLENRQALLRLSAGSPAPESAEELGDYLNLAASARALSSSFVPAHFGLSQTRELADEMQRRYVESYYDLKTIPAIESLQDSVIAATDHADPAVIGNTLLMLIILRESIIGGEGPGGDEASDPLLAIAETKGLIARNDLRQLAAFSDWAGDRTWLGDAHVALRRLEANLLDNANRGDPSWLCAWLAGIPGLEEARLDSIFEGNGQRTGPKTAIPAAFCRDGFQIVAGLMARMAEPGENDRRRRYLSRYKRQALEVWRQAATELFAGGREFIADADLREGIQQAVRRDDPAARFAALACRHLLPMMEATEAETEPDFLWLAEYARLSGLAGANPSSPASRLAEDEQKAHHGESLALAAGFGAMAARFSQTIRNLTGEIGEEIWPSRFASFDQGRNANPRPARATGRFLKAPDPNFGSELAVEEDWKNWLVQLKRVGLASHNGSENLAQIRKMFAGWREHAAAAGTAADDIPLSGAEFFANRLHRHLREYSGSGGWDGLSPLSSLRRFRHLLMRQAALSLDSLWRDSVYNPLRLTSGSDAVRRERLLGVGGLLEKFLTGPAAGFWDWEEGRIVNARGEGTEFLFSPVFLDYCNAVLARSREEIPESCAMLFRVDSVQVDPGARERPEAVEFFLSGVTGNSAGKLPADKRSSDAGSEQSFIHRNYPKAHQFNISPVVLDANPACRAGLRVKFRSCQAEAVFEGVEGVKRFIELFSREGAMLRPEAFGLEGGMLLKKLRVSGVKINGEISGGDEFLRLPRTSWPTPPERIISVANPDAAFPDKVFGKKIVY